LIDYFNQRRSQITYDGLQHVSLVVQCVILATIIALIVAIAVYRSNWATQLAEGVGAVGLTIPSFALLGLLIAPFGLGVLTSVIAVTFYAILPILRNAVVGLAGVDRSLIESARGIGMSRFRTLWQVEIPLAWPVILNGIRVSTQMVMGIAAVAAYVLGPGLGGYIFEGLSRLGGSGALPATVVGTVGVIILAFILDVLLLLVGRVTTSRGIRV
jgi:osmoprotectant transport system permease protein